MTQTTHEFKAEIKQLLDLITHSLYTNKEIFLRELASNASDALDKLRYVQSSGETVTDPDLPLEIRVDLDKDNRTIVITDTGVGMTHDEIIENIGTIARSGSGEFLRRVAEQSGDGGVRPEALSNIIGRFGVGFYSVFMVADKVTIRSKSYRPDEPAVEWTSDGSGTYELKEAEGEVKRGSRLEIRLKEAEKEYAEDWRAEDVLKRHSSFLGFPILLDGKAVNTVPALWREPKFSVKPEQYAEFYKFLTHDADEPMLTFHQSVDAPVQFTTLAFIPKRGQDLFGFNRDEYGLDLYVRRVLIKRQDKALIPEYLGFLRGVADTEDLPLNVSRETLQENRVVRKINAAIVKHVLKELQKLAKEDKDKYLEFWREHGKVFKLGYNDFLNREAYAELLLFNSSAMADAKELTSLEGYVSRLKRDQKDIYYLSGPSREAVELSPHLEIFRKKGLEVLFLYEPVDEFILDALKSYKEYQFKPAEHVRFEDLKQYEDAETPETKAEPLAEDERSVLDRLLARVKDLLGDKVTEVRLSERLTDSPSCLVSPDGVTSQMQKIFQVMSKDASVPAKIFEVNQDHKLIRNLLRIFKADPADPYVETTVRQLYESALLLEGYLSDPHAMVARVNKLLEQSSGWYAEIKKL